MTGCVEPDRVEIDGSAIRAGHAEPDRHQIEDGRAAETCQELDRHGETIEPDRKVEIPVGSCLLADEGVDGPASGKSMRRSSGRGTRQ